MALHSVHSGLLDFFLDLCRLQLCISTFLVGDGVMIIMMMMMMMMMMNV